MDDDDDIMRPPDAFSLTQKQVTEELERRRRKGVGFLDDDQRTLQEIFNAEFEIEREEKTRERQELKAKQRADEEALRLKRLNERDKREENEAVAADKRVAFWIDLLARDATPPDMVLRVDPVAFRAFVKALLPANTSLKTLDACGSKLHDDVGVQLGLVLQANTTALLRLDLDFNGLGPASLSALARGLAHNTHLRSLSLERNPLTGEGGDDTSGLAALAAALATNSTLRCLGLFHCGLGAAGGRLLADALEGHNHTLVALQLSPADGMETEDLARITRALRRNVLRKGDEEAAAAEAAAAQAAAEAALARGAEEEALKLAEQLWIQTQKVDRARARAEAEYLEHKAEVLAEARREAEHKERRERWRAEEEAKAKKKAKKAEKGKKKKK